MCLNVIKVGPGVGWPWGSNASGPGGGAQAECVPSACQVGVYLQGGLMC